MILAVMPIRSCIPFRSFRLIIETTLCPQLVGGRNKKYSMPGSIIRKAILLSLIASAPFIMRAQPDTPEKGFPRSSTEKESAAKPYRILTSGKTVTIRSAKNIKSVMVWTSAGHRIIEEKNLNTGNYTFRVTVNEKLFFLMVQLIDGKTYSEKIGVQ
jgi:hypothetical protein